MKKKALKILEITAHILSGSAVIAGIVFIVLGATATPLNETFIWSGIGGILFGLFFGLILHAALGRSFYSLFRFIHDIEIFDIFT